MSNEAKKLELGIEIISAMRASCFNFDIEEGRVSALMETETDRLEGVDSEMWESFTDEQKEKFTAFCLREKERLHEQALYVAGVTLDKLSEMMWLKY